MLRRLLTSPTGFWSRLQGQRHIEGTLSAAELERAFHRERARVDRTGGGFSMVVFTPRVRGGPGLTLLVDDLLERMRIYDSLGLLDSERVAMLLPETTPQGAWSFADDCVERVGKHGLQYGCEVFGYPLDWRQDDARPGFAGGSEFSGGGARSTGTDGPQPRFAMAQSQPISSARPMSHPAPLGFLDRQHPVHDLAPAFVEPLPIGKRLVDLVVASTALGLLSPLLIVVAALVKLTTPGPIIFKQWRAGRGGRPFLFYKFRSMYVDAEARKAALQSRNQHTGPIFKIKDDPRITPLGRLLRRTSIDELPQLLNVLKGDMTLIGPRPPTMDEVAGYEPWQRKRLEITGGLTCIWQVSGRSEVGFEEWVRMDLEYLRKRSLLFDMKLLLKTIGAVITGRGAY